MIPFRTQRLATSVVNRIMNVYDGLPPRPAVGAPNAPDPPADGPALEARLAAPQPPVDAAPQEADAIALAPLLR